MPEYKCDRCGKDFNSNQSLKYHINKNVCARKEHCCKYCPSKFTSKNAMYAHMRDVCKSKKQNDADKEAILDRLMKMEEEIKKQKEESDKKQAESDKKIAKLTQENAKIKTQMKKVTKNTSIVNNINNGDVNNINNGTIVNATINIVGHGTEDISKIGDDKIHKSLQAGFYSTVQLTKAVHFNPDFPEFHNIYIPNIKDKYAMKYNGEQWILTTKEDLINTIYEDKKSYIEANMEDYDLTESRQNALERWLALEDDNDDNDDNDHDHDKIKDVKEKIKLMLYNSRNMTIATRDSQIANNIKSKPKSQSIKAVKNMD